jgi:hypothetical protein
MDFLSFLRGAREHKNLTETVLKILGGKSVNDQVKENIREKLVEHRQNLGDSDYLLAKNARTEIDDIIKKAPATTWDGGFYREYKGDRSFAEDFRELDGAQRVLEGAL